MRSRDGWGSGRSAQRAGREPDDAAATPHLRTGDLAWVDIADAVWLTAATQYAWGRGVESSRSRSTQPPADDESETDRGEREVDTDGEDRPAMKQETSQSFDVAPEADLAEESIGYSSAEPAGSDRDEVRQITLARTTFRQRASAPDIFRACKPFKRRVPSPLAEDEVLDEEATAERAVEDGLWLPITESNTTRWLDLTLVVDSSPSMSLWRSTVNAVITSLERLGAFRSIQRRLLDTSRGPLLRGGTPDAAVRSPAELVDPSGRRVVLIITDGVGACWRQGLISPMLAEWGTSMSVAVAHVLPQRLWRRGGLCPQRAKLNAPQSVAPNRQWSVELPDSWLDPDPMPRDTVAVPILELETRWLARWAQLVAGEGTRPADGMVMLAREERSRLSEVGPPDTADPDDSQSSQQRVKQFLSTASPPAFRLATLLAAVPVSVPVARTVQAELVPDSGPDHVAEVLTSGLLRPSGADSEDWETTAFAFDREVREILLSGARRSETARVVRVVADVFGDSLPGATHLRDVLEDPAAAPTLDPSSDVGSVEIERALLNALSGPYLHRVRRLQEESNPEASRTETPEKDDDSSISISSGGDSTPSSSTIPAVRTNMSGQSTDSTDAPPTPIDSTETPAPREVSDGLGLPSTDVAPPPSVAARILRERQADDVPPIWGDVPPRNPIFTGREEPLAQLDVRRSEGGTTAILPAALHGMGGIGKTQIAVEYIYRHLQDYDLVWWVQATQSSQIRADLTQLAQALRLPGGSEANTAVPAVREALRRGNPIRRWLLVFDAAESPEVVRPFFPANGPGDILITSRNPDWAEIASPLEVELFQRSESKKLLRGRGPEISDEEADALADKLGDLPLAIAQAASWRAETGMPVSEYLRVFEEKVAEILDASASNDYEVSLAAAWNVSFDQLETRNPAAHQLLQVCAFFSPEPISRSLFTGVRGTAISPELDAALRDPIRLGRAIRDINRYGLAKIDHRNNTLQLHRLVQMVLRDRMSPQRAADMRHGAHLLLANLDPNAPSTPSQWQRYHAILPHAYSSEVLECADPWVRQLVIDLMEYLYYWGDHEESTALAQQAIDVWSRTLDENDPQLLRVAGKLGFYLWTLGRYPEAAEINERTLAKRRATWGEKSEETLSAELNVGFDLKAKGEFFEARDMNEQTYQKAKGLCGEDDPVTLGAAHDLAVSMRLVGDFRRARELDDDTFRRQVEVRGYDSAQATNTLAALILDRLELGDYSWAHAEMERLTERSTLLFGADKAITLQRQHQLSIAARKNGDHYSAFEMSKRSLERFRFRYGANHPNTLACAISHSIDLRQTGDLEAARSLSEDAFNRYRRNLGENHPHTLAAAVDLAVTLRLSGEIDSARQLDERCTQRFRAVFGPDQPLSLIAAINLASDVAAQGETETALTLAGEAARRAEGTLGVEHPTAIAANHNLALDLRAAGRDEEADAKQDDVLTRYRRVLGESHPDVTAAVRGLRANCDIDPSPL